MNGPPCRINSSQNPTVMNGRSLAGNVKLAIGSGSFETCEETFPIVITTELARSEVCERPSGVRVTVPSVNIVIENWTELFARDTVEFLEVRESDFEKFLIVDSAVTLGKTTKTFSILSPSVASNKNTRGIGTIDAVRWINANANRKISLRRAE